MSWSGFKKSLNRTGTMMMQKTGQIDRTVDTEFQDEVTKFKTFEKECIAMQKESKAYMDAMRTMTSTQTRISDHITNFYQAADRMSEGAMASHAYKQSVTELDDVIAREFENPYRTTIMEPLGKMNAYFPIINDQIGKRNKKLLDFDAAKSKYNKNIEKPSEDPNKGARVQQEYEEATAVFEMMNKQLIDELPRLLELRVPFFDPSFEAMVRMQSRFAEEGYEKLGGVQRYFADNVRDDYAEGQLDAQVERVLQQMRELSICGAA